MFFPVNRFARPCKVLRRKCVGMNIFHPSSQPSSIMQADMQRLPVERRVYMKISSALEIPTGGGFHIALSSFPQISPNFHFWGYK